MSLKFANLLRFLYRFVLANLFIFITGFLVVAKLIYFDIAFSLMNEFLVLVVVSLVLVFTFLSPIAFFPEKRIKYATILNIVFSLFILADTVYIRYFNSLPSFQSIFYVDTVFGVWESVLGLVYPKDILLFVDSLVLIMFFKGLRKRKITFFEKPSPRILNITFVVFCLCSLLFITFYDSKNVRLLTTKGFDNRVIAERYSLTGYHVLDIYRFAASRLDRLTEEDKAKYINEAKNYIQKPEKNDKTGITNNKRIIMVQIESLQSIVVGKSVDGQEITPNINNLTKKADYFSNNYYEMGFGGTADSDFTVNTSLYPLRNASTFVQYAKSEYTGLAAELEKQGYKTNAYHGFNRSFWNRNVALKSLGYQKFLGAESYEGLPRLLMGVADEPFYQKTAEYMGEEKAPSLSYVISLTSHFPFTLPSEKQKLKLDKTYPKTVSDYYQAMHLADKAFGVFIEKLKEQRLYEDSLIVVYGDHAANVGNTGNLSTVKALGYTSLLSQKEQIEIKKVPLIIHLPGQTQGNVYTDVTSHIDIMPTILNLVGLKAETPIFGRDIYGTSVPYYASVLYFENGFIESGDRVYLDGAVEGVNNGSCYVVKSNLWTKTESTKCLDLVNKRNKEINLSEKLIKYNLFKDIK